MFSLLANPTLWLQLLIGAIALPGLCLFLGVLVCVIEPSATRLFENQRWYQVLIGLTVSGGYIAIVLAVIGALTWLFQIGVDFIHPNDWSYGFAFVLSLVLVLGGIYTRLNCQ